MARKSKIENSPFREYIEEQLKRGVGYRELEEDLREKDFLISHTALHKWHTDKLGGKVTYEDPKQFHQEEEEQTLEFDPSLDAVGAVARAFQRQAQIFEQKQEAYMRGGATFPARELRALKDLSFILSNTPKIPKEQLKTSNSKSQLIRKLKNAEASTETPLTVRAFLSLLNLEKETEAKVNELWGAYQDRKMRTTSTWFEGILDNRIDKTLFNGLQSNERAEKDYEKALFKEIDKLTSRVQKGKRYSPYSRNFFKWFGESCSKETAMDNLDHLACYLPETLEKIENAIESKRDLEEINPLDFLSWEFPESITETEEGFLYKGKPFHLGIFKEEVEH